MSAPGFSRQRQIARWLAQINEGLYPFYILHQTVIIWVGYYVCRQDWSIAAKFWAISLLTLIGCLGFYLICIRPSNLMRLLFGIKPKKRSAEIGHGSDA